jgi:hypothetical protein
MEELEKLSMETMFKSVFSNSSIIVCDPIYPAPPVTMMVFVKLIK